MNTLRNICYFKSKSNNYNKLKLKISIVKLMNTCDHCGNAILAKKDRL